MKFSIKMKKPLSSVLFVATSSLGASTSVSVGPEQLALVINDSDPQSKTVGQYYANVWQVPSKNIFHVSWSKYMSSKNVVACAKDPLCIGYIQKNSSQAFLNKLAACLYSDSNCIADVKASLVSDAKVKACVNDSSCNSYVTNHSAEVPASFTQCAHSDSNCVIGGQSFLSIYDLGKNRLSPTSQIIGIAAGNPAALPVTFGCWSFSQMLSFAASPLGPFQIKNNQVVYSSATCDAGGYFLTTTNGKTSYVTNPIFNSDTRQPFTDFKIRPTMVIASTTVTGTLNLIDRSHSANLSCPKGTVIAEHTCDGARNVRDSEFTALASAFEKNTLINVETINNFYFNSKTGKTTNTCNYLSSLPYKATDSSSVSPAYGQIGNNSAATFRAAPANQPANPPQKSIQNPGPIIGYFTGTQHVPTIENPTYRSNNVQIAPGAIGDTLTSFGGVINYGGNGQGYATQWIEAGFSGSSGTVTEPGADPAKFSDPSIVMTRYATKGETLVEAYSKSSHQSAELIFVGDPLVALCN